MATLTKDIINNLNKEVLNQLDLTEAIEHPGENGRAREQILAAFFRKLIPQSFGVSTGFVIDAQGRKSKQIDLIIYRNDYHPVFEIGGIRHFMVESVAIVMENKASIKSTKSLNQALENLKSVKMLDRTNCNKNYILTGSNQGPKVNPDNFQHQIFGAILTEDSLSRDTLMEELFQYYQSNPDRNLWPNFYADVRHMSGSYLKSVTPAIGTVVPSEAMYLGLTDCNSENFVPPLCELAFEVINFLRVMPKIDYHPSDYLGAGRGKIDWLKL
jgi:hypothetical protein